MNTASLTKFWPLVHSVIQEFWAIVEPPIEDTALRESIPIELYTYSEFGSDSFSTRDFQKRDPFTNPLLFDKAFVTLNFKGWIEPLPDDRYGLTESGREAARRLSQVGEAQLLPFESYTNIDLFRLAQLLKQIVKANEFAPEPPEKWAINHRLRTADKNSPLILQIRDYLLDLFAYRDDSHITAAHPHFGRAGIIWIVLGALCNRKTVTAGHIAEALSFRGYDANQYEVALQAAVQIGWAQETKIPGVYSIAQKGRDVHDAVEQLTDEYFYAPWSILLPAELDELYSSLSKLREQLNSFRKR